MSRLGNTYLAGRASPGAPPVDPRRTLVRAFALAAVGALCLAALAAILIFLFGEFQETEGRILITTLAVAGYSLIGLAATTRLARPPAWLAPLGLGLSAVGFVLMLALIWTEPKGDVLGQIAGSVLVLAVAIAHAALLLPRRADPPAAGAVLRATLTASAILAAMLIRVILLDTDPGERYARWLGVVAVLDVLGTLLVPILRKLTTKPDVSTLALGEPARTEAPEAAGMTVQFKGRTFAVSAVYRQPPDPGFEARVWEVTPSGNEPVAPINHLDVQQDPHAALALAILRLTWAVDQEELGVRSAGDGGPPAGRDVPTHRPHPVSVPRPDSVEEASVESFPASDAPGWIAEHP